MYSWFNCMEIGPCAGWMKSNATLRAITSKRAKQLNKVLSDIAEKEKFDKFDIHYVENPFRQVLDKWVASGGQVHELIEPVDSLHPTQAAQALIARQFWNHLEKNIPHVLGPVNPHPDHLSSRCICTFPPTFPPVTKLKQFSIKSICSFLALFQQIVHHKDKRPKCP